MKCVILAAGYATRLYPLTENFPKPLLKVGDKTILDWLVDDIAGAGLVDEFVVISNHKFASHFKAWASEKTLASTMAPVPGPAPTQSSAVAPKFTVVDDGTSTNETRLGAVRDVQFAIDSLGLDDDMLVIAGDNVLDFSLVRFVKYAAEKGTPCIMRYFEPATERLRKCGVISVGQDDLVLGMEEKPAEPKSNWCCPPFYFYTREAAGMVAKAIDGGCGVDAPGSFIAWLAAQTPVHAMLMPGSRYDIGNLQSYEQVQSSYRGILK